MTTFTPFRALRPAPGLAQAMLCPPYDVLTRDEARAIGAGAPHSYVHVIRADADFPDTVGESDPRVHARAASTFARWVREGILVPDARPTYSVYRERIGGHSQCGIVGLASTADYEAGLIKRHEVTLEAKERDRIEHFRTVGALTEPVWLAHRPSPAIAAIIEEVTVRTPDACACHSNVDHEVWVIDDDATCAVLRRAFADLDAFYIADGHHRAASAAKVARSSSGCVGAIMAVAFSADELQIMDYNRVVTDLGKQGIAGLTTRLEGAGFALEPSEAPVRPEPGSFGLYHGGRWWRLTPGARVLAGREGVDALDVSVLQDAVFEPLMGITNPRTDPRLSFVGGVEGLDGLVARADATRGAGFALPALTMATIMEAADAGRVMPPKSTWFEPKLGSGLFAYALAETIS